MNTDLASSTALSVSCSRDELASALGVVSRGLSTRGAVQVLSGILLQADEGKLTLAATDMEISLRASVAGSIEGDGSVVVPGRLLTDLVRLLPDANVTLAHEEGEGVLGGTLVPLVHADHRAERVRADDLVGVEVPSRPRRLAGAGHADEHDEARVGEPEGHRRHGIRRGR